MVWGLVRDAPSLVRYAPMGGIIGLDWPALLAAAGAMGIPEDALIALLPSLEAGMLQSLAEEKASGSND